MGLDGDSEDGDCDLMRRCAQDEVNQEKSEQVQHHITRENQLPSFPSSTSSC